MPTAEVIRLEPQPGPQTLFLQNPADVVIYGGAAGGGKTYALLMDALRHVHNPDYGAVIFRRTHPQVVATGGLWDTSETIYAPLGASPAGRDQWRFPSGAEIRFRHLQHEKNKYDWQGAQIPFIGFDELTHFSWTQFSYLMSRNRSVSGVRPVMRGTCNPDPDHWLRKLLDWWIDENGYPIPSRQGALRWMALIGGEAHWADSAEELIERHGADIEPISFSFVASRLDDNPALESKDPGYRARLKAMPAHERAQLLEGNWNARPVSGSYFQRHWFEIVDAAPPVVEWVRYWDLGATEPSPENPDPDYTVGVLLGKTERGQYVWADMVRLRDRPREVERAIVNTASRDGRDVTVSIEREPGASGKMEAEYLASRLAGYRVKIEPKRTAKEENWKPLSSQAEAGNVMMVRGSWNDEALAELEGLPTAAHDDIADAASGAFIRLTMTAEPRIRSL